MSKTKICITGADGFIGHLLVERLRTAGCDVLGLTSKDHDISKPFGVDGFFDHAIHLAAYNITHVGAADKGMYQRINVEGTRHTLKGIRAEHFIFMSTAKVYKDEGKPVDEHSPVAPRSEYAKSKRDAEEICHKERGSKGLTIVRSTNVVGEGQAVKAVIPVFFEQAYRGEALRLVGSGRTLLQLLYVGDLIDLFEALIRSGKAGGTFNAAPVDKVYLGDLARMIVKLAGSRSVIESSDDADVPFAEVSAVKARSVLGWQAKTSVAEILQRHNSYYAKQR